MNNDQIKKLENDVKTEFINAGNELLGRNLRLVEESVRAVVEILNLADVNDSLPNDDTNDPVLDMALDITFYKHGESKDNTPEFNETLGKAYDFINKLVDNDR